MNERRRIIGFAIAIMAAVSLVVAGTTIYVLYQAAFAEEEARLVETVKSQARLIEAIARFNAVKPRPVVAVPDDVADLTLSQLADAHEHYESFAETGEFAVARRDGDRMVFLISHRQSELEESIPLDSGLAEPMRLALSGRSGTIVGPDYRGATVLAAYEPVAELNWGIVAKVDLAEIRAPFVKASLVAGSSAVVVILLGAALSLRVSGPLLKRLEESEEHFHKVFDYSNDAIFVLDAERDRILDANATACKMLQYSRAELLSTPISAVHPDEMPQLRAFTNSVLAQGSGWTDELTCLTKSGTTLPAEISASTFEFNGRHCVLALVRDITERKQAERALRESEERFSSIIESAIDAIITIDAQGTVRLFNEAAEGVFRCTAADAISQPFDRFASEALRKLLKRSIQGVQRGGARKQFIGAAEGLTARRVNGEEFVVEATLSQAEAAGERLFTIILRDVDERLRAEEELRRLEIENIYLREQSGAEFGSVVGRSTAIRRWPRAIPRSSLPERRGPEKNWSPRPFTTRVGARTACSSKSTARRCPAV